MATRRYDAMNPSDRVGLSVRLQAMQQGNLDEVHGTRMLLTKAGVCSWLSYLRRHRRISVVDEGSLLQLSHSQAEVHNDPARWEVVISGDVWRPVRWTTEKFSDEYTAWRAMRRMDVEHKNEV
jgi:hypothetical protein